MLLTYVAYNIVQYVIRQGRYKEFHITFFYLNVLLILILRITQFAMNIFYYHSEVGHRFEDKIVAVGVLAAFFEGTLGL